MSASERQEVINKYAHFTGLDAKFIDNANLRVRSTFPQELLRDEKRSIGRLDARFKGFDSSYVTAGPDFDASEAAFVLRTLQRSTNTCAELGYKSDLEYYILGGGIGPGTGARTTATSIPASRCVTQWRAIHT
jgi:hypothetical protein